MVLISDDFESGKSTVTKIKDLSDEQLKKLVLAGAQEAIDEYARRVATKKR